MAMALIRLIFFILEQFVVVFAVNLGSVNKSLNELVAEARALEQWAAFAMPLYVVVDF